MLQRDTLSFWGCCLGRGCLSKRYVLVAVALARIRPPPSFHALGALQSPSLTLYQVPCVLPFAAPCLSPFPFTILLSFSPPPVLLQVSWEVVKACYMTLMRDHEKFRHMLGEDKASAPPAGGAGAAPGAGPAVTVKRAPASKAGFQQVRLCCCVCCCSCSGLCLGWGWRW